MPDSKKLHFVDETFDKVSRKILSWKWGDLSEKYTYSDNGQMAEIMFGDHQKIQFKNSSKTSYPSGVTLSSGASYGIVQTRNGGLYSIITPAGIKHQFLSVPLIGKSMIKYTPPWSNGTFFVLVINENGKSCNICQSFHLACKDIIFSGTVIQKVWPSLDYEITENSTTTSYPNASLTTTTSVLSFQDEDTNVTLVLDSNTLTIQDGSLDLDLRSSQSDVKDQVQIKVFLENGTVVTSSMTFKIGESMGQVDEFKFDLNDGQSAVIQTLDIRFIYLMEFNKYGGLKSKTFIANGKVVHHQTFAYNFRNQLNKHQVAMQRYSRQSGMY